MRSFWRKFEDVSWWIVLFWVWSLFYGSEAVFAAQGEIDLPEVLVRGELRHLGEYYGNFITGTGDGLTVDLMRGFADFLGVRYRFIPTSFKQGLEGLLGQKVVWHKEIPSLKENEDVPLQGDVIAGGFVALPSRGRVVAFSKPIFISQLWVIAKKELSVKPIVPSGSMSKDIQNTITKIRGFSVLGIPGYYVSNSSLWLEEGHCVLVPFYGVFGELIPGLLKSKAQLAFVDMTGVILGTLRWPGKVKVVGPLSPPYYVSAFFRKSFPRLREAFNDYLRRIQENGKYMELIDRYFPSAKFYFPDFFKDFSSSK